MFAIYSAIRPFAMIIIIYFYLFCMYRIFIITKYDNNVITIFDNDKYIYHSFSF